MNWIEYIVVAVVVGLGLAIMYKALKEPLDLLFGAIGRGIKSVIEKISGSGSVQETTSISYG